MRGVWWGQGVTVAGGTAPPKPVVVVVAVGVGGLQAGPPRAAGRHGGQLELDQHHVVAQTHREVEWRLPRQEVIHLYII